MCLNSLMVLVISFISFNFSISITIYNRIYYFNLNLDPLDPLTEIINSGQGFSPAIALERIIWAIIGVFFLGAISKSITNTMRSQNWFSIKSLFSYFKDKKITDSSSQPSNHDE